MMAQKKFWSHSAQVGYLPLSKNSPTSSWASTKPKSNDGPSFQDLRRDWQDRTRELFLQNADQLLWYATVITGDADSAVDCLLATTDEACESKGLCSEPGIAWAKLLVINSAIRRMHSCLSAIAHEDQIIEQQGKNDVNGVALPTPETACLELNRLTHADLLPTLLDLNCMDRTIYLLLVLEGWTRVEVANTLGMTVSRTKSAGQTALMLFTDTLLTKLAQRSSYQSRSENIYS